MRALFWVALTTLLTLSWGPVARADAELRARVVRHGTPEALCPGEARPVEITLLNTGSETWDPASKDRIAYHWRDAAGAMLVRDGARTVLPGPVAPGAVVTVSARLKVPVHAGALTLQWSLVREGVRWVPTDGADVAVNVIATEDPPLALAVHASGPNDDVVAGDDFTVDVTVRNVGCVAWSHPEGDNLAYHWYSLDGRLVEFDGQRTPMPDVGPGQEATVTATVRAPAAGEYHLQWAMVREGLAWTEADPELSWWVSRTAVGEAALAWAWAAVEDLPEELAVGELATTTLALTNMGTEPWLHESGDRLGYRWIDASGEPLAEEGLRTTLPAVVAPGETVQVTAQVQAPQQVGPLTLVWEPVREGVRWFGPAEVGPTDPKIAVTPARLAWALVEMEDPGAVWVGRERTLAVTVKNLGADTWSESTADHLSYRWLSPTGEDADEGMRTVLAHDVAPGETITAAMRLRGPSQPGRYTLRIEMVREHVRWFGAPRDGEASLAIVASRAAVGGSIAFIFVTFGLIALRRKHLARGLPPVAARVWLLDTLALPLWTTLAVGLVGEVFVELGGVPLWDKGVVTAWSCCASAGLLVAALPQRVQGWGAALAATFAAALALADLAYLNFFGSIVPLTALAATHHLGDAHGTVSSLLSPEQWWLVAVPASGFLLASGWGPRAPRPATRTRRRIRGAVAVACVVGVAPAVVRLSTALQGKLGARVFSQYDNVGRFGLFGAHYFELARQIRDALYAPQPPSGEEREALDAFFAERTSVRAAGTPVTGQAKGYNVIIIQVEALSSWARGLEVNGQPITPYLDAAAAGDAWLSHSIYDQTAQGRTSDAEYLVLSSSHPLAEGALSFRHGDNHFQTLVHTLVDQGYSSLSAHPYARGFWNRAVLHPRYGFDNSMFRRELGPGPMVGWGLSDAAFLERMVEPIAALPEPWVTFMITLSLHHPYDDFPDAMKTLDLPGLDDTPVGNYLQAMRHFDDAFATFMGALAERGLADRTIVALYGDHVTGIESRREVWSLAGWDAWSPDLPMRIRRVPLVIWAPGVQPVASADARLPRGQIDVGPTVADLLGVPMSAASVGVSLAAPVGSRPVVLPNGSAVGPDRIFVGGGRDIPREGACFDLPSGTTRPWADCEALAASAREELGWSRAVVEHDLHRALGEPPE